MFNVKLVDIGGDGLVTEFNSVVDTLPEVEKIAALHIRQHLGVLNTELRHEDELVYSVLVNGHDVGLVVIRSL